MGCLSLRKMNSRTYIVFIAVMLMAAFFRFWGLSSADVVTDEAYIGFRALGWLDFLGTQAQGTPVEWFERVPWWVHLSFHDHPPFVFALQKLFFSLFGDNLWALRLPSVLAGVGTVVMMYLLGVRIFREKENRGDRRVQEDGENRNISQSATGTRSRWLAIFLAAFASVSIFFIWPARLGLQESIVLFFMAVALYFFVRALENHQWWSGVGMAVGLGMLTKYTFIVMPLVFVLYLVFFQRGVFKKKEVYGAALIALVLFFPVILYNIMLYQSSGHFDLQIASFLGQDVPVWQNLLGKEIGTMGERFKGIWLNMWRVEWPIAVIAGWMALGYVAWQYLRVHVQRHAIQRDAVSMVPLVLIGTLTTVGLLLLVGPGYRFLTMIWYWMVLALGVSFWDMWMKWRMRRFAFAGVLSAAGFLFVGAGIFSIINFSLPAGARGVFLFRPSLIQPELKGYGFNELESILDEVIFEHYPEVTFEFSYQALNERQMSGIIRQRDRTPDATSLPLLIVYDANLHHPSVLWYFLRRMIYEGWPVLSSDGYASLGSESLHDMGIRDVLFVRAGSHALLDQHLRQYSTSPRDIEKGLHDQAIEPVRVIGNNFTVYRFEI